MSAQLSFDRSRERSMAELGERIEVAAQLKIERSRGRSVVTRAQSAAPLRLLAPSSPGRAAWVYQSSLGGGFVGRDAIELAVEVAAGARLFLTSQSSSKVYRRAASRFGLDAAIGDGGVLVAWPDPIACFAGAAFEQRQRFRLAKGAGLVAVDAWTAGRVAHGECWAFGRLALRTDVEIDGAPVLHEAVVVSPAHGALAARMGGARAFATVVIAGASFAEAARAIGERVAARAIGQRVDARAIGERPAVRAIDQRVDARAIGERVAVRAIGERLAVRAIGEPVAARASGERVAVRAVDEMPRVSASVWPWGAVVRMAAPRAEPLSAALQDVIGGAVRDALGADPFARKW